MSLDVAFAMTLRLQRTVMSDLCYYITWTSFDRTDGQRHQSDCSHRPRSILPQQHLCIPRPSPHQINQLHNSALHATISSTLANSCEYIIHQ